jgi:hypothetical protein
LDVCKTTNFTGLKAIYRFKSIGYGVLFNPETLVETTQLRFRLIPELGNTLGLQLHLPESGRPAHG